MEISALSKTCTVRKLVEADIPAVLRLCQGNPQYYEHCPPAVTTETIRADMRALPPNKGVEDKYYLGLWDGENLAAVLDLIVKYPNEQTAFLGFFMVDAAQQGQGFGSQLVEELCAALAREYKFVRLGYVKGNPQSERFWYKNHFLPTGIVTRTEDYEIIVMERTLERKQA